MNEVTRSVSKKATHCIEYKRLVLLLETRKGEMYQQLITLCSEDTAVLTAGINSF